MLSQIWYTLLYQPLFNALIWIYSTVADFNLGWAVIWLTVFLRILMLPLTVVSERNVIREQKAEEEAEKTASYFKHDQIMQKEEVRKVMRRYKISPWAKVAQLAIQFLVLVLLYQVFVRGITGERISRILYQFIDLPGKINTNFYGFEIGMSHDLVWASITALYLFFSILIENKGKKWQPGTALFLFAFPLFTYIILWALPMVKSLFILTSMMFSTIIALLRKMMFPVKTESHDAHEHH